MFPFLRPGKRHIQRPSGRVSSRGGAGLGPDRRCSSPVATRARPVRQRRPFARRHSARPAGQDDPDTCFCAAIGPHAVDSLQCPNGLGWQRRGRLLSDGLWLGRKLAAGAPLPQQSNGELSVCVVWLCVWLCVCVCVCVFACGVLCVFACGVLCVLQHDGSELDALVMLGSTSSGRFGHCKRADVGRVSGVISVALTGGSRR
jgi:hypothetical protein